MQRQNDWSDLIGVLALFVVFVILPLLARLLKQKQKGYRAGPGPEEAAPQAPKPEEEILSEFDRYMRMKKTLRQKKAAPAPEPPKKVELVVIPERKQPRMRIEPREAVSAPLTQIVQDLPDAAQAIILAEIISRPKALQSRRTMPFIRAS